MRWGRAGLPRCPGSLQELHEGLRPLKCCWDRRIISLVLIPMQMGRSGWEQSPAAMG